MSAVATVPDYRADAERWLGHIGAGWEDIRTSVAAARHYPPDVIANEWDRIGAVESFAEFAPDGHVRLSNIRITTGPLDGEFAYWAFMHEVGHIREGHHELQIPLVWLPAELQIQAEMDAWAWAFDNSPFTPSDEARRVARWSLESYFVGFGVRPPERVLHSYLQEV